MKQWGGRFKEEISEKLEKFSSSLIFDHRLYEYDIRGSIAHAEMLGRCGIIKIEEAEKIISSLKEILEEIKDKGIIIHPKYEDIHTYIENKLWERIGELAGKLHTARSRNDQIALDIRLYLKDEVKNILFLIKKLQKNILEFATKNIEIIFPGYTHLQQGEPVLLSHHIMAYFWMFQRDIERFRFFLKSLDELPLGAASMAGTSFPIDQELTSNLLDFSEISNNSIDAVSNRDFILDILYASSLVMMHLSRFSEELIIWSSKEFAFIELRDRFATGSSIMPQKKNPDVCELIRGKCGRIYGNLVSFLSTMKALPLSYNRDLQEDKEVLFNSIDTLKDCLDIFGELLLYIEVHRSSIEKHLQDKYLCATEIANYLVNKGVTFRVAHEMVGKLILKAISKDIPLDKLKIEDYKEISPLFEEDVYRILNLEEYIERKRSKGGTSKRELHKQIERAKKILNEKI
jgi:argininosuccinate lyase